MAKLQQLAVNENAKPAMTTIKIDSKKTTTSSDDDEAIATTPKKVTCEECD